jgi:hypothetical protein
MNNIGELDVSVPYDGGHRRHGTKLALSVNGSSRSMAGAWSQRRGIT